MCLFKNYLKTAQKGFKSIIVSRKVLSGTPGSPPLGLLVRMWYKNFLGNDSAVTIAILIDPRTLSLAQTLALGQIA